MVNVIIDDRNNLGDRDRLLQEFERQGIPEYKFWDANISSGSVVNCISESHKQIVKWAMDNGLEEVVIAEQDIYFPNSGGWEYFLKNKPIDFDIYIGGTYLLNMPDTWESPIVKVNGYVGNHLIIIKNKYFQKWLDTPKDLHIDTAQEGKGDFYVCFPFAALQRPGFSSNCKVEVNYNSSLKKEWIYQ